MKQPTINGRREYLEIVEDRPSLVNIPDTRKFVKIRGVKPYTLERLTRVWMEREQTVPEGSSETLRSMCIEPYLSVKEAVLFVLNDYWKIRLFYGFLWRWWGKVRGYTEAQMTPIIAEGKKKLPLMAHWTNMAYSVDMRTDWMKMTKEDAEQYRAELLSAVNLLSSKSSPATEGADGSSSD